MNDPLKNLTSVEPKGPMEHVLWFCLTHRLVVILLLALIVLQGIIVAPFDWHIPGLERDPVPVDAIPDVGENQQIVLTEWMGRSPRDVDNQITYPLTSSLLGITGIKSVRSYSYFGASYIYVIFEDSQDYYNTRSRILEKLSSIPKDTLPAGVTPMLGPDATGLGQIYLYTLEGRDRKGKPNGGWDLQELRSVQDWYVRYALLGAKGVSEVTSIGGYVREYQIDIDPNAMRAHGVSLEEVYRAVSRNNQEVGASNLEVNRVEYFIRGLGYIKSLEDLQYAVVKTSQNVPLYIKDIGRVSLGPAQRRGALDKAGVEAVGGVVIARYGENPLATINHVKQRIQEISAGLPERTLPDGSYSKLTVVPFYDRSGLIDETLGTLRTAISEQVLITMMVILVMLMHLRGSILVSVLLPLSVLLTFLGMKFFHVDANIVALSGIAIAIGTLVDMGIILVESNIRHFETAPAGQDAKVTVFQATAQVGGEVMTAVATTIISFLPVFAMEGAEGKLFKPLALTKTMALVASIVLTVTLLPAITEMVLKVRTFDRGKLKNLYFGLMLALALVLGVLLSWWITPALVTWACFRRWQDRISTAMLGHLNKATSYIAAAVITVLLTSAWLPLGVGRGYLMNYLFVVIVSGSTLLFFQLFKLAYGWLLEHAMRHRILFSMFPVALLIIGLSTWLGFKKLASPLPDWLLNSRPLVALDKAFPGLGKEFMPNLDEGSFLYMPTTSGHAAINESLDIIHKQDRAFANIPEVAMVVGKLGSDGSALDPAPISMFETNLSYKAEYAQDASGKHLSFAYEPDETDFFRDLDGTPLPGPDGKPYQVQGRFKRDDQGQLIPEASGMAFRQWRPALDPDLNPDREAWLGIKNTHDIWNEISKAGKIPGTTSAPELQPIAARMVMLQSGMRAPMGIKLRGPDLETLEKVGIQIEHLLKQVPSVAPDEVTADRIIGKPYLEYTLDRLAMARFGLQVQDVQEVIEVAIGGVQVTTTIEGRERYPVRVRYQRELRDTIDKLNQVIITTSSGAEIPISQVARLDYTPGPQVIKSEDTFLTSYVLFGKKPGFAEVDVVEEVKAFLKQKEKDAVLKIPNGVSYTFAGTYENQDRASRKLAKILPISLALIFLILYLQFRRVSTSLLIFSAIMVAWAGGFLLLWLFGQTWFLNFHFLGTDMRGLFQVDTINLSVAVWVGFLALFGIASDDGVLMSSYMDHLYAEEKPDTIEKIRATTLRAGKLRVRAALMTTATTIIALIPVLTATGRGADIMRPMAIPTFGGMLIETITVLIVPVYYSLFAELRLKYGHWFKEDAPSEAES